ncbi:hypothetical protein CYPRO_2398 [Cyclonatronum proteinivorum]|uniref:Uncharacterized protein n=1 Tax=Cyclonatronum proteinivorum TaxID=1457365 RepID=A0A345UMD8_9BACT|nr:hypothetical protein CYPRO_2398 [Cyclonatronum proteinivorum]
MFIAPNDAPDIHDPEWGRTRVAGGIMGALGLPVWVCCGIKKARGPSPIWGLTIFHGGIDALGVFPKK